MKRNLIRWLSLLLIAALVLSGCAAGAPPMPSETISLTLIETTAPEETQETTLPAPETEAIDTTAPPEETGPVVTEDGTYTSKEEVAAYLHLYHHLPSNYITKSKAQDLGWVSNQGNLDKVAPGKSIGGDRFGNYEGLLPKAKGRTYTECDIDFDGHYRNAKRIIFSNDGLIYYTEDHYASFELLYGEE